MTEVFWPFKFLDSSKIFKFRVYNLIHKSIWQVNMCWPSLDNVAQTQTPVSSVRGHAAGLH